MSESRIWIRVAEDRSIDGLERVLCEREARKLFNVDAQCLAELVAGMGELSAERALRRLVYGELFYFG